MAENTELSESQMIVIAHLSIIAQSANGFYKPQPGEIDRRQALVSSFIRTGQCIATDDDRRLIAVVRNAISPSPEVGV